MISFSVTELARIAHIPTFATALVKGAFTGVLTVFLIDYFMRRPVQRRIRMALDAMGMPTCIACGYDLRGQTEPRCPECGAAYSGTLPSEREPSGESLSK